MAQSLAKVLVHITFSTKDRRPLIAAELRERLTAYLVGILERAKSPSVETNCVADHVHILCRLSRTLSLAGLVEELKTASSKWAKTLGPGLRAFYWQGGYGAFSVSSSNVEKVREYIRGQEEHHRKASFQEEFRELLRRHGVEFDERYVWE